MAHHSNRKQGDSHTLIVNASLAKSLINWNPKYSYLNCDSIINDLGISRPNWKKSLSKIFEKK